MTAQFLLLLFPLLLVIGMKIWRPQNFSWLEAGVQIVFTAALIVGMYHGGKYLEMSSVEFWHGTVNSKHRDHGSYVESYDCRCRSVSSGTGANKSTSQVCDTCYRDHYTVNWYLDTTLGSIGIQYLDRLSRSVYNTPDPRIYVEAYPGEHCAKTNTYVNYVQAASHSLLNMDGTPPEVFQKAGLLPEYPQLHNIYRVNPVLDMGVGVPNLAEWNKNLRDLLRELGPTKQANVILVLVKTADTSYQHALQRHWRGGNKNDIVIVLGVPEGNEKIEWAGGFSWGKNKLFDVTLRDRIMEHGKLDVGIMKIIQGTTLKHFERRPMSEFEYLKDEIDPPLWMMIILVIVSIGGSLLLAFVFDRIDLDEIIARQLKRRSGYRRTSIKRRRF